MGVLTINGSAQWLTITCADKDSCETGSGNKSIAITSFKENYPNHRTFETGVLRK